MHRFGRRFGPLGWLGVLMCGLAIAVLVTLLVADRRATSGPAVRLADRPRHVVLPPDRTYGIYVDDANNSGYHENCSAIDSRGGPIRMTGPPWSLSSSDTETLDIVYNTGSGHLTIDCSVPGEIVTTRPVPDYWALLLGALAAGALALVGVILIIARLTMSLASSPSVQVGPSRQVGQG